MSHDFSALDLRVLTMGAIGITDIPCPICGPGCRSPSNRTRKVFRVWDDGVLITYRCARCDISGWAKDTHAAQTAPQPRPAAPPDHDRAELAGLLWSRARPLAGSLAETYLRARMCFVPSPNLRCLPARGIHAPAMIASFGIGNVTGVHLTKLDSSGKSKAGTDRDKIMIGKSIGQPIVIQDNPERGELILAEGIEDAATLALITGWTAWAAGSAGRIPAVVSTALNFDRVLIAVDGDAAGSRALKRASTVRRDIVPLHLGKVLAVHGQIDANKAILRFGPEPLLAAIEWCDAQARFKRREIGFHAMQAAVARANRLFGDLV